MKPEEIQLTDYMRIILGEVPWSFLIESVIRIAFIFVLIMVSMRLMGRRMASLLSRNEMAALVSLAAAVGVPMQDPNRGLLPAVIIAAVVVGTHYIIGKRSLKSSKFECLVKGNYAILIKDGCLQLQGMKSSRLTHERLFAQLRYNQISHLGHLERVYIEANGDFSIWKSEAEKPGLSILPDWDTDYAKQKLRPATGNYACCNCGNVQLSIQQPANPCSNCGKVNWKQAVQEVKKEREKAASEEPEGGKEDNQSRMLK